MSKVEISDSIICILSLGKMKDRKKTGSLFFVKISIIILLTKKNGLFYSYRLQIPYTHKDIFAFWTLILID